MTIYKFIGIRSFLEMVQTSRSVYFIHADCEQFLREYRYFTLYFKVPAGYQFSNWSVQFCELLRNELRHLFTEKTCVITWRRSKTVHGWCNILFTKTYKHTNLASAVDEIIFQRRSNRVCQLILHFWCWPVDVYLPKLPISNPIIDNKVTI